MLVIRTAEEMAHALNSPLHPELKQILSTHRERLSEYEGYDLSELATFVIAEPGDEVEDLFSIMKMQPGEGGAASQFSRVPEYVEHHRGLMELVFILSDDGFGLVLIVPTDATINASIRALAKSYIGQPAAQ